MLVEARSSLMVRKEDPSNPADGLYCLHSFKRLSTIFQDSSSSSSSSKKAHDSQNYRDRLVNFDAPGVGFSETNDGQIVGRESLVNCRNTLETNNLICQFKLVLLLGAKLQHVIATMALESAGITGELCYISIFKSFLNAFELASFFWFWWQFGYNSCFLKHHTLVYIRLILGFAAQFLCSYSTLPLYALVTQMGINYKAALIPQRIRETIKGWRKESKRSRRKLGIYGDDSTIQTETSTVISLEEFDHQELDSPRAGTPPAKHLELELQPLGVMTPGAPRLRPSASALSSPSLTFPQECASPKTMNVKIFT
ncbi:MLO-like protein 11 [Artemisia annua]|uniref:MLO-like protein 11 n=1 Tax=Artemisia annua TaxID=35608 RepID=A0A2U1NYP9_ARTAN|nr:MLO-like protein 11 [Artemisia annua]